MKTLLLSILVSIFLFGCSQSGSDIAASTPTTGKIVPAGTKTCLSKVANGSYAVSRLTGEKVALVNGCFDLTNTTTGRIAARSASVEDTIIIKNDSSLFSLTIPVSMLGDTFQMVQTDMSVRRAKVGQYDSIIAIVYDSTHIKERKAAMRKASTTSSVDYTLKFYSPDTGKPFQVHFEYHKGAKVWTSELVTAEPGSSFDRNDTELNSGSVPFLDTATKEYEYGSNWIDTIKASSMYGIATITIDGKEVNTISDTSWGINVHTIKIIDNAGYSNIKTINRINGHTIDSSEYYFGGYVSFTQNYDSNKVDIFYFFNDTAMYTKYKGHLLTGSLDYNGINAEELIKTTFIIFPNIEGFRPSLCVSKDWNKFIY